MKKKFIKSYRRYSLTELVVVMAIVILLLAVTGPAFNAIFKGNAINSTANDLGGIINATRSYAIEKRCYTALVFPQRSELVSKDVPEKYFNASYRPCIVYKDGTTMKFLSWIDGQPWKLFHVGIIIPDAGDNFENGTTIQDVPLDDISTSASSPKANVARALVFTSTGQFDKRNNVAIRLAEGLYNDGSFVSTNKAGNYSTLTVHFFNGRTVYGMADADAWKKN